MTRHLWRRILFALRDPATNHYAAELELLRRPR
jgi:hypothetical protein